MIYDPESNLMSWEISQGEISHVHEFGDFIIHVSKKEKPILVEILNASKFVGQIEKLSPKDRLSSVLKVKNTKKLAPIN